VAQNIAKNLNTHKVEKIFQQAFQPSMIFLEFFMV